MWNTLLIKPILNLLVAFYKLFFSNLGLAILGMTIFIRLLLFPLAIPTLKMAEKQRRLQHKLDALKKKHKGDKKKLTEEQMRLMKAEGINPALGCLPQIAQLIVLIALYQVFIKILATNEQTIQNINNMLYANFLRLPPGGHIETRFLYLNLSKPDPYYVLPVLAGLAQWVSTKVGRTPKPTKPETEKTVEKEARSDIMLDMQSQMGFLFPLMTIFIGLNLSSGLVLYWLASVLISTVQQWWVAKRISS